MHSTLIMLFAFYVEVSWNWQLSVAVHSWKKHGMSIYCRKRQITIALGCSVAKSSGPAHGLIASAHLHQPRREVVEAAGSGASKSCWMFEWMHCEHVPLLK